MDAPWNEGQTSAYAEVGDLRHMRGDYELLVHHYWVTSRLPVAAQDPANGRLTFAHKSVWRLTDDYTGKPASYRVHGSLAHLQSPGNWASDSSRGKLFVVPPRNASRGAFVAIAPVLERLVAVKGATNVRFQNVQFSHTEVRQDGSAGDYQAAFSVPGALVLEDCVNASIANSRFENLGGYAVEILGPSSSGNVISRSTMRDLGAGGIKIGHLTTRTTVEHCTIEQGGRDHASAVGIWIGNSGQNRIANNRIRDLYYTGISVGWTWGYGPARTQDNLIEFNDIREIGQGELSDMGGIYTLGNSQGSLIRNNRIDNVRSRGYGGWGIYFDEGTTGMVAENNVVSNTTTGGFHQHYGRENVVRNNVFAYAQREGQVIRTRKEDHLSFTFERNIVIWRGTPLLAGNADGNMAFRNNVYWKVDGAVDLPPGDQGSIVADPLLEADFRLKPGSPALAQGFRPIDLRSVGPQGPRRGRG